MKSCLDSLPRGSEVVFHLDPSVDDSSHLLQRIKDPRFTLIETSERLGFSEGLNFAIENSKNSLIARLDADDIALPWRWQVQLRAMRDLDLHFGSLLHYFPERRVAKLIPGYPVRLQGSQFSLLTMWRNPGFHPSAMLTRDLFSELGGYRKAIAEDYDLWLRAVACGARIRRDSLPVTVYRHHGKQATADPLWEDRVSRDPLVIESKNNVAKFLGFEKGTSVVPTSLLRSRNPFFFMEFRDLFRGDTIGTHSSVD